MSGIKHWLTPDWPAPANIHAATTLRVGGVSGGVYGSLNPAMHVGDDADLVTQNRQIIKRLLGLPGDPVWLDQIHSHRAVQAVTSEPLQQADASYTSESGIVCAVMTADCLPLLMCSTDGSQVAAIHAGWRGLLTGVISHTVSAMQIPLDPPFTKGEAGQLHSNLPFTKGEAGQLHSNLSFAKGEAGQLHSNLPFTKGEAGQLHSNLSFAKGEAGQFDAADSNSPLCKRGARGDFLVWLGPAIGPDCFEVGAEVRDAFLAKSAVFIPAFKPQSNGKWLADIYQLARIDLGLLGIDKVYGGGFCTVTEQERFYSYRRDKQTGRMATLIWRA